MSYTVKKEYISYNRSGKVLTPQGFVIHATATPGATAQNEHDYFNSGNRQASAHFFVDWEEIIQTIPENEQAWHAGPTANSRYLSVEMCEPADSDPAKFQGVWDRTIWLVADACVRYKWNTKDDVFSHRGISLMYHETDHTDPIGYLTRYGKSWDQLLAAIDQQIKSIKGGGDKVDNVVMYFSAGDYSVALLAANKLGGCGMFCRNGNNANVHKDVKAAKKVINIGGADYTPAPEQTVSNYCGATALETADKVVAYLKSFVKCG